MHGHDEGVVTYDGHTILLIHNKAVTGAANARICTPEAAQLLKSDFK